jgi:hypothetical protein
MTNRKLSQKLFSEETKESRLVKYFLNEKLLYALLRWKNGPNTQPPSTKKTQTYTIPSQSLTSQACSALKQNLT